MALIKCPECGKNISDVAKSCPKCGYPLAQRIGYAQGLTKKEFNIREIIRKYRIIIIALAVVLAIGIMVHFILDSRIPTGFSKPVYRAAVHYVKENERFLKGKPFKLSEKDDSLLMDVFKNSRYCYKYTSEECIMGEQFGALETTRLCYIAGSRSETEYRYELDLFKRTIGMK